MTAGKKKQVRILTLCLKWWSNL